MKEKEQDKIYREIQHKYEKATKTISELGKKVSDVADKSDVEEAIRTYDYILQSILLREGLSDGTLSTEEIVTIKSIVNSGDILKAVAEKVPKEYQALVDWETISMLPAELQQIVCIRLEEVVDDVADDFALFTALANMATKKDYVEPIIDSTADIIASFAKLSEKDGTDKALAAGVEAFQDMFVSKYLKVLERIDEFCDMIEFVTAARAFVDDQMEKYSKQDLRDRQKKQIMGNFLKQLS